MKYVRIPLERVAVLIGKKGGIKSEIEKITGIKIYIDSKTGEVSIDESNAKDPLYSLKVMDVITAIGRGFSPSNAMLLFQDDVYMEIMDIKDYAHTPNRVRELKGRVIGRGGRTREIIEQLTDTKISIYGHKVAIIGRPMELDIATYAIDMLLRGCKHGRVYSYLEQKAKDLRMMKQLEEIEMVTEDEL